MNGQPKKYYTIDDFNKVYDYYQSRKPTVRQQSPYQELNYDLDSVIESSRVQEKDILDFLPDFVKKAYNQSITGMTEQLITGEQRFNLDGYQPGVLSDIGAGIVSFFMPADFVATIAGAGVGGVAGRAAAKTAISRAANLGTKKLIQNGTSKQATKEIIKSGTEKILSEAGRQSAGFGVYSGIASALKQKIDDDNIDWTEVFTDSAKGSLSAGVGGAVLGRANARGTAKALAYTQEAAAFGTIDPILDGRLPSPMDYVNSVGFALGISGTAGAARKLKEYKRKAFNNEYIGEFDWLSVEDRGKQNSIANALTESMWDGERGIKRWEIISPKPGDVSFTDVSIIGRQPAKGDSKFKGDSFKIIDNNTQAQRTVNRERFFRTYQESKKSRIKTESNLYDMADELKIPVDAELDVLTNGRVKKVSELSDRDLNNFQQRYFKQYQNLLFRRGFAQYSADMPQSDRLAHIIGERAARFIRSPLKSFQDKGSQAIAKNLLDLSDNISGFEARSRSDLLRIKRLIGVRGIEKRLPASKAKLLRIYREATGKAPLTKENKAVVDAIKKWSDSRFEYARKGGIIPKGKIEKYLPNIFKADVKERLFADYVKIERDSNLYFADNAKLSPSSIRIINKIIGDRIINNKVSRDFNVLISDIMRQNKKNNPNMTYAEAYALFREDIRPSRINPHGYLERQRKFKLPEELLETDPITLMAVYDSRLGRRVETARMWGRNNEGINKAISEVKNASDQRRLTTLVDQITGFAEVDLSRKMPPEIRSLVTNFMGFEAMTKISGGDATIANVFQPMISTIPSLGIGRTAKGFIKLLDKDFRDKLPTVYADFIREIVGQSSSTSIMRKASELAGQVSLFTPINKFNNMLASATAKIAIDDYIKMYQKNPTGRAGRYAKDKLRKLFNIDVERVDKLTNDKLASAMASFAKKSQLQRDYLREPTWLSNPILRPLVLFKSFGVKQAGFITEQIRDEWNRGNPLILARLAMGGMIGGAGINWAKGEVSRRLSGREYEAKEDTMLNEALQSFGTVGAFGMLSDFMDAEDLAGQIEFTLKPVFYSDIEKSVDAFGELMRSVDEFGFNMISFRRAAYKASPIFGTNARRLSERFVATQAQKRNAQSGRKGKVRTDALKLMSEGNTELAKRRILQWNKSNPTNPITYNDVNYKQIYKYLLKKNMKVKTEDMTDNELRAYRAFMRS